MSTFEEKLRRFAEVAIKVGVGLQSGQKLFVSASVEALPLTRLVVEEAYKAGSRLVVTQLYDEQLNLARYRHAPRDSFEEYAAFMVEARLKALDEGYAWLSILADDPELLCQMVSGLLFYETLYDENAASHIAFGASYDECLEGGHTLSQEQKQAAGANNSLIHIDWMIGSGQIEVDGITQNGQVEALMRGGEWVD